VPDSFAPDIEQRIDRDFSGDNRSLARHVLAQWRGASERPSDRLLRCVLLLASGDVQKLRHFVEQGQLDYRDVIYWAEYDRDDRRIHDFNQPFPD